MEMINRENINKLINSMTENSSTNVKKIKKLFGTLDYKDSECQSILHILVDNNYKKKKCFLAIKSLLDFGVNPNLKDDFDYIFIQTALYTGYSEDFICDIIKESLKYKLNVNHVDSDGDTIMHTVIYSDFYIGEINYIYHLLCDNGFDSTILDRTGKNLFQAMVDERKYTESQINIFKNLFENRTNISVDEPKKLQEKSQTSMKKNICENRILSNKELEELETVGKVLTNRAYVVSPAIGRDKELKNLMITLAQEKKLPIVVGESGVGKTALVEELAYRINTGQVPKFLQNKVILEITASQIAADGSTWVGEFEKAANKVFDLAEKYDVILFIDEIHTIYGIGSTVNKNNDLASMLKHRIDRTNLKVIGTTTEEEYTEYFSQDALKRRFEKIVVEEPKDEVLYVIIDKVINDYYIKTGIGFENEEIKRQVIEIILEATKKNHRVYDDMVNNPDLAISIIDKAVAFAKVYDSEYLTEDHFIESFEYCNRIYDTTKEQTIRKLKNIKPVNSSPKSKILRLKF